MHTLEERFADEAAILPLAAHINAEIVSFRPRGPSQACEMVKLRGKLVLVGEIALIGPRLLAIFF